MPSRVCTCTKVNCFFPKVEEKFKREKERERERERE